jgi:hypothetical protein
MNKFVYLFKKHFSALLGLGLVVFISLACGFQSDADWQRELGEKKLTFAKTSGSISDKINIWFCPNGQYAKETQFTGFSGGGGGDFSVADRDGELGNWKVENGVLILQSEEGKTSRYDLSKGTDNNLIRLNGNGYLVTSHNECR